MMSHNARRVCGSSPALGSSRKSTCGSCAMARAICTRCASPPESWATFDFCALGELEQLNQLVRLLRGLGMTESEVAAVEVHVLENRALPVEGVELRHHSHEAARLGGMCDHINAGDRDLAAGGQCARGANANGRRFARAIRAEQAEELARGARRDRCP